MYIAMSIAQGGCGLPLLHNSVFQYLVSDKCTSIEVDASDMPEPHLMDIIQKVDILFYNCRLEFFVSKVKVAKDTDELRTVFLNEQDSYAHCRRVAFIKLFL